MNAELEKLVQQVAKEFEIIYYVPPYTIGSASQRACSGMRAVAEQVRAATLEEAARIAEGYNEPLASVIASAIRQRAEEG